MGVKLTRKDQPMPNREQMLSIQFKNRLGLLNHLDFSAVDIASAHHSLGQDARGQIAKILAKRLDDMSGEPQVIDQVRRAHRAYTALENKTRLPGLDQNIKTAVQNYIDCLSAWAQGAQLADFRHHNLPASQDGQPILAEDLATLLQEDEGGCQTGAYRERDGSVILWHAEEDVETQPGQRFDKLRLFSFRSAGGQTATGFIYPDLLPGPTFGWQGADFAQAIDTLHVRNVHFADGILPNTLAWLSLYLGAQISRRELATKLGPFLGGYSITGVCKSNSLVSVEKVEYANDQVHSSVLPESPGSFLFQTNIIGDLSLPIGAQEHTSPESRAWNTTRIMRTARLMRVVKNCTDARPMIFRLLRSNLGGESAYSNRDVKAYFVCHMQPGKTSIWAGPGAAMKDDPLFIMEK